jgi:hypothetical protein
MLSCVYSSSLYLCLSLSPPYLILCFLMPLMEGLPICGSILLENPNSLSAKVLFTSNIIYSMLPGAYSSCSCSLSLSHSLWPLYLILHFWNAINAWSCQCGWICWETLILYQLRLLFTALLNRKQSCCSWHIDSKFQKFRVWLWMQQCKSENERCEVQEGEIP